METSKRRRRTVDYKALADVRLPRASRKSGVKRDKLYPVKVVDKNSDNGLVKIHYVGYSSAYDEWRNEAEVVESNEASVEVSCELVKPFSLYEQLCNRIKCALNSGRKDSPSVRIDMPFDKLLFDGGLRSLGTLVRTYRGTERYRINHYRDLNPLLGVNWHFRGLNCNGDFCYAILASVQFYVYKRHPLLEYVPSTSGGEPTLQSTDLGYMLVFTFVRGDGTRSEFGKDKNIFFA